MSILSIRRLPENEKGSKKEWNRAEIVINDEVNALVLCSY